MSKLKKYYKNNYYKLFLKRNYDLNGYFFYCQNSRIGKLIPYTVIISSLRKVPVNDCWRGCTDKKFISPKKMVSDIKHSYGNTSLKKIMKEVANSTRRSYNKKLSNILKYSYEDEFDRPYYEKNWMFSDRWSYD